MEAKRKGNNSLSESLKHCMTDSNGKFSQKYHDEETEILNDNNQMEEIYRNREVIRDDTLVNEEQCLIKYKIGLTYVQYPAHLNSLVLSYAQKRMACILNACNGFKDWDNTFWYADTDSLILHHKSVQILEHNHPDWLGKKLGQIHERP